jgi:hypothetical protein
MRAKLVAVLFIGLLATTLFGATRVEKQIIIKGTLEGELSFVELPFTDEFPYPYNVGAMGVAMGQIRGLGNSTIVTFHHPTTDGRVIDGLARIVAANGDVIRCQYSGTTTPGQEPDQLIGSADLMVTGGTGRFENASGMIHVTGYVTVAGFDVWDWPVTWVLEGAISYPGQQMQPMPRKDSRGTYIPFR